MDISNPTQMYNFLASTGLVDKIPNGRNLMACIDEYSYNCSTCTNKNDRKAVYNRCCAIYEELVGCINAASTSLIFQRIPDLSVTFRRDGRLLKMITR